MDEANSWYMRETGGVGHGISLVHSHTDFIAAGGRPSVWRLNPRRPTLVITLANGHYQQDSSTRDLYIVLERPKALAPAGVRTPTEGYNDCVAPSFAWTTDSGLEQI